jgi:PAS domain S-box-containing protein
MPLLPANARATRKAAARVAAIYLIFAAVWIFASDRLLEFAVLDPAWLARIGTVKGMVFVTVTTLLLYLLLRTRGAAGEDEKASLPVSKPRHLIAAFIALALVVPLLGYAVIRLESQRIRDAAFSDLNAIADLKTSQIESWLHERWNDADALSANDSLIDDLDQWLHTRDGSAGERVVKRLQVFKDLYRHDIQLLDPEGRRLLAPEGQPDTLDTVRQTLLATAPHTGQIQVSDLYRDKLGQIRLDYAVPLVKRGEDPPRRVAVAVMRTPVESFLFPLIQSWPTPSPSAETLIFRREGNNILFLNELRHRKGTALSFRLPLDTPGLPAAIAIRSGGKAQAMEGIDYRGIPVLTAIRPVLGTSWLLLAKADRDEVLRPLHHLVFWISLVALAAIAAIAAAVILLWRREERAHRLELVAQSAEKDRLLKLFYDLPFIGMAIVSAAGKRWLHANDRLCEILGSPLEELQETTWEQLAEPDDPTAGRTLSQRVMAGEMDGYQMEKRFVRKNGSVVDTSIDVKSVHHEDGSVEYLVATVEDITERKLAEVALRESQSDMKRAQAVGHIGSWRLDVRRNELAWSEENHRIFGMPEGTPLTYETFLSSVHPDDREYVDRMWQAGLRGEPYDIEHRIVVDGTIKWVREKAELEYDRDGTLLGGFGTTQDITGRKWVEEKLRIQLRLVQAITDCAADSIFVTDENGRTTFMNREAEKVFGYSARELGGKVLHDVIHHHHPDGRPYPINECPNCRIYSSGETVRNNEEVFFRKDGSRVTVACSNAPLQITGKSAGAVLVTHDITDLKHAQQTLIEADRRKDEFLAMLAHELRNPLAPIRTAAHVLGRPGLDEPKIKWAHDMIEKQVTHLVRLVDDLLDISRIVRGKIALKLQELELGTLVRQVVEDARPLIDGKGQKLEVRLPEKPSRFEGDPVRLSQVLFNLLDNAVKYTPEGGRIELAARLAGEQIEIKVRDNGMGIPADLLPYVFDLFQQGERTLDRAQGGLGLGLTLVRRLVELHGGTIEVESTGVDQGSEFTVRLPLRYGQNDG